MKKILFGVLALIFSINSYAQSSALNNFFNYQPGNAFKAGATKILEATLDKQLKQ